MENPVDLLRQILDSLSLANPETQKHYFCRKMRHSKCNHAMSTTPSLTDTVTEGRKVSVSYFQN